MVMGKSMAVQRTSGVLPSVIPPVFFPVVVCAVCPGDTPRVIIGYPWLIRSLESGPEHGFRGSRVSGFGEYPGSDLAWAGTGQSLSRRRGPGLAWRAGLGPGQGAGAWLLRTCYLWCSG